MSNIQNCRFCGLDKEIMDFPKRGNETDRFGNPVYRKICKACEADNKLKKYHQKKITKEKLVEIEAPFTPSKNVHNRSIFEPPKSEAVTKNISNYAPWEKIKGRGLTSEEVLVLESSTRELIIALMEIVIKEKGRNENGAVK